jgi:hypothetical protein
VVDVDEDFGGAIEEYVVAGGGGKYRDPSPVIVV